MKTAVLLSVYNAEANLCEIVQEIMHFKEEVIVINDGSSDSTCLVLDRLQQQFPQLIIIHLEKRRGKGAAMKSGMLRALDLGYEYVITLEASGTCDPQDIPHFMATSALYPDAILVGTHTVDEPQLLAETYIVHKFPSYLFRLATDLELKDTHASYRLYPLHVLGNIQHYTSGYEFELESLIFPAWHGVEVRNMEVHLSQKDPFFRASFRPIIDSIRLLLLSFVLIGITFLWVWPRRFLKNFNKKNINSFIRNNITHSPESNERIAASIGVGIFMSLTPMFGYQMVVTGLVAHFAKLNKVLALASSNLSLPFILPWVLYGSCVVGAFILRKPMDVVVSDLSFHYVTSIFGQYLLGGIVFALLGSILFTAISYLLLKLLRK